MAAADIPINDLYTAIMDVGMEACIAEDGVHMTPFGAQTLASTVIAALHAAQLRRG